MAEPKRDWTIMVYMAGDNNLCADMINAIVRMMEEGTKDKFHLRILLDPSVFGAGLQQFTIQGETFGTVSITENAEHFTTDAGGQANASKMRLTEEVRHSILKPKSFDFKPPRLDEKKVREYLRRMFRPMENSADPYVLKTFIEECLKECPAENYMLVLSGHGSGSVGDFLKDDQIGTSKKSQSLSIPHLAWVLKNTKNLLNKNMLDILGMDSCLMSTTEVAYQVREHAHYLVGAEGFGPSIGWPYHTIFNALKKDPSQNAKKLSCEIVKMYSVYYTNYELAGVSTDHSASDLTRIEAVAQVIHELANQLSNRLESEKAEDPGEALVTSSIILVDEYKKLAFCSDDAWYQFLEKYVEITRRKERNDAGKAGKDKIKFFSEWEYAVKHVGVFSAKHVGELSAKHVGELSAKGNALAGTMKNPPEAFYRPECKCKGS